MSIHITFKISIRPTRKRVEKASTTIIDVDSDPVTARDVRGTPADEDL